MKSSSLYGIDPWLCLLFCCYSLLTIPALLGLGNHEYEFDQEAYHLPTVREISRTWPALDFQKAAFSAVSPGYHYFLATLGQVFGTKTGTLRWINWGLSFLLPLTLYRYARFYCAPMVAACLGLPFLTSNFFVKSACWLYTDNAALVFTTFGLVALMESTSPRALIANAGLWATAATACRQVNIWLIGPIVARRCLDYVTAPPAKRRVSISLIMSAFPAIFLGLLMPLTVVLVLYRAWGGLVPEQWRNQNMSNGLSSAAFAYALTLVAVFGSFYVVGTLLGFNDRRKGRMSAALALGAFCGFCVALLSRTSYDVGAGHWGGYLWAVAQRAPVLEGRSSLFMVGAPIGGWAVVWIACQLRKHIGWKIALTWLAAVLAWLSSLAINRQVFQRYYEPIIIVFLVLAMAPLLGRPEIAGDARRTTVMLVFLSIFQTGVTLFTVYYQ